MRNPNRITAEFRGEKFTDEEEKEQFDEYQNQLERNLKFFDNNISRSNYTKFKEIRKVLERK